MACGRLKLETPKEEEPWTLSIGLSSSLLQKRLSILEETREATLFAVCR